MFADRAVTKEYMALVVGTQPFSAPAHTADREDAAVNAVNTGAKRTIDMALDVNTVNTGTTGTIDMALDGKSAVTAWELLRTDHSMHNSNATYRSNHNNGPGTGNEPGNETGPSESGKGKNTKRVVSTLLLQPRTGRTHQLRRHLKGCGFPIGKLC